MQNKKTKIYIDKAKKLIWSLFRACLIIGISYIIIFPLLVKISSSVMSEIDMFDHTVNWVPKNFTLDHFLKAWEFMPYPESFRNSLVLTTIVSVAQLFSSMLTGYGLARFKFRGKGILFGLVIFTLVVPPQTMMIPLYLNFRYFDIFGLLPGNGINLLGSFWPYILLSITGTGFKNGLFIYIMRQFFKGMPRNLEEAAYIDGAGSFKTFYKVMLPGALPAIVVVFLFGFVWQWNDLFFANIFLGDTKILTRQLIGLSQAIEHYVRGSNIDTFSANYQHLINNAASVMVIAPLLLLYGFMQKYFIESVERTGIVG
ncbi:MAG: carbohydrate ABC transporter permease [Bacillota bacterium]